MIAEYKTKTNVFVGLGLLIEIIGAVMGSQLVRYGGAAVLIVGCVYYARAKGRHAAWGLLGMFNLVGLIILACFSDKSGTGAAACAAPSDEPAGPA
jgi:hypothetical protein